jgi:glycosyltransferase involved in cell wall biosynthesis
MKAIFFHDHKIISRNQILYSTGGFNKSKVDEYSKWFSSVTLATRCKDENIESGALVLVGNTGSRLKFLKIDDLSTINLKTYFDTCKKINNALNNVEVAIVRLPSTIGLLGYVFSKLKKKNIIVEMVGCPWDSLYNYGGLKAKIAAPLMFLLTKVAAHYSHNTIYVTNQFLQNRYPSKYKNSVGCSDVVIDVDSKVYLERLEYIKTLFDRKVRIGIIGALGSKYKGFDKLFECANILERKFPGKYEIDIVGGGDGSKLTGLIDKLGLGGIVSIIGSLSHPVGINKWLDSIDIYVQPSKQEGLPRAVIEAMSRGCTCIGSTAGGIPELLESDFIHQQEDVNAFASLIIKATKKESLVKQCKRNFSESKKYTSTTLDRKRNEFYRKSFNGDPE